MWHHSLKLKIDVVKYFASLSGASLVPTCQISVVVIFCKPVGCSVQIRSLPVVKTTFFRVKEESQELFEAIRFCRTILKEKLVSLFKNHIHYPKRLYNPRLG